MDSFGSEQDAEAWQRRWIFRILYEGAGFLPS